ncbi:hypothetical protein ACIGW7_04825 [Streptomyces sp. NPDC053253]|uniref:hypothetical protein n=1 Tax=Streptomyces sp. NPDC053253 TaxID=3365699 RepID=UPI0037D39D78
MFEIRIICDPADTDRITVALARTFTTGAVRVHAARSTGETRLYVTAEHRADVEQWPTPEQAYAGAPSVIDEIGWTVRTLADDPLTASTGREFWLRKAALLDRIVLGDDTAPAVDATDAALQAARQLMDFDDTAATCDPRHYVRQQYARWTTNPR